MTDSVIGSGSLRFLKAISLPFGLYHSQETLVLPFGGRLSSALCIHCGVMDIMEGLIGDANGKIDAHVEVRLETEGEC